MEDLRSVAVSYREGRSSIGDAVRDFVTMLVRARFVKGTIDSPAGQKLAREMTTFIEGNEILLERFRHILERLGR